MKGLIKAMKKKIIKLICALTSLLMLFAVVTSCTIPVDENESEQETESLGTTTPSASVAIDMTAEWEKLNGKNTLVQGCLVINTAFAAAHPNEVAKFLEDYSASVNTIKSGSDDAINMIVSAGILPKAAIAKKALPNCNICYIAGKDMPAVMDSFCNKIYAYDKTSIGGALPTSEFYYTSAGDASKADKDLEIKVYALNGTTALGMAQMINNASAGTDNMNYNISLHQSADGITGAIVSGECAIAALPTNVAVKLFNKSQGKLKLLALNTLGVLYLVENGNNNIASLSDLKGKTIYLPGAGSNPEYITAALLESAGLKVGKDVFLDTTSYPSPDALQTAFVAGSAPLAVLPEPKVTVALTAANSK